MINNELLLPKDAIAALNIYLAFSKLKFGEQYGFGTRVALTLNNVQIWAYFNIKQCRSG